PGALQRRGYVIEPRDVARRRLSGAREQEPREDRQRRVERGPALLHQAQHSLEWLRVQVQAAEPLAERREAERRARVVLLPDDEAEHQLIDVGDLVVTVADG